MLALCCPLLSVLLSVIGGILGILALKTEKRTMAMWGIGLCGFGIFAAILSVVASLMIEGMNNGPGGNNAPFVVQPPQPQPVAPAPKAAPVPKTPKPEAPKVDPDDFDK